MLSNGEESWLGLEVNKDGSSVWYDKNPSTYRNWLNGTEPKPSGIQKCVTFSQNGFADESCNQMRYYVAKKVAGSLLLHTYNVSQLK